jgi:hypothetical protein
MGLKGCQISELHRITLLVACVHISECLLTEAKGPGYHLTTLFATVESSEVPTIPAVPTQKKKHSWLPVLTVLFLISYALMTMLIVEQGQTIESQRALIRELFRDSTELSAVKQSKIQEERRAHAQNPTAQTPSTQVPDAQAPKAPSTQAQQHAQNHPKTKTQFEAPSKPAVDLVDVRRTLITL